MPSLSAALHKLSLGKHKRSGSTSSNGSAPASPRQSLTAQRDEPAHSSHDATTAAASSSPTRYIPNRPAPPPPANVEPATKALPLVPDEAAFNRPELPTTTSNVNNPPVPSRAPQLPPLPHVTSLEQPFEDVDGVKASSGSGSRSRSGRTPPAQVPPRISSVRQPSTGGTPTVPLHGQVDPTAPSTSTSTSTTTSTTASWDPRYVNNHWYSSHGLQVPTTDETAAASAAHIEYHLKHLRLPTPSATPNVILPKLPVGQGGPSLEEQRQALVMSIAAAEESRPKAVLSDEGRKVFEKAGFASKLGIKDTIDVRTRWLEPVIQERVIRREHHEYTYEIYNEVHKYHIYPKIQPIFDPNPIVLPTRHRFRDADGNLREVVGDAAARAILGDGMDEGVTTYVRTRVPEYDMVWNDGCDLPLAVAVGGGGEETAVGLAV